MEKIGTGIKQAVGFRLGREEFGIDIMKIVEIIRMQQITRVPQMPDFIEGIINLRGNVIPVVDLGKRFNVEISGRSPEAVRIILSSVRGRTIGLVADSVSEVIRLADDSVVPPPPVVSSVGREFITGVARIGKRLLIILDIDRILSSGEHGELGKHFAPPALS